MFICHGNDVTQWGLSEDLYKTFLSCLTSQIILPKEFLCFYFIDTINHVNFLFCYGHQEALNEICGSVFKTQLYHINHNNGSYHLFFTNNVPGVFHQSYLLLTVTQWSRYHRPILQIRKQAETSDAICSELHGKWSWVLNLAESDLKI